MGTVDEFNKTLSTCTSTLEDNGVYYDPSLSTVIAYDNYPGPIAEEMAAFGGINSTEFRLHLYRISLAADGVYNLTLDSGKSRYVRHRRSATCRWVIGDSTTV